MTGIFTKQNIVDSILGGGGGGSNNQTLNDLHVLNTATFDGETKFANIEGHDSSVTFQTKPKFEQDMIVTIDIRENEESPPKLVNITLSDLFNLYQKVKEEDISALEAATDTNYGYIKEVSERVEELSKKHDKDSDELTSVIYNNTEKIERINETVNEHDNAINEHGNNIDVLNSTVEELTKDVNDFMNGMKKGLTDYSTDSQAITEKSVKLRAATLNDYKDPVDDNEILEFGETFGDVLNNIKNNDAKISGRLETLELGHNILT